MSKRIPQTVEVQVRQDGLPGGLRWAGRRIGIRRVFDDWEEAGCWWLQEEPRQVYRVVGDNGVAYELHHQASSGWRLYRVFD